MSLALLLSACAVAQKEMLPMPVSNGVAFTVLAPKAKSVALVGSFNGWSPMSHPMTIVGSNGLWRIVVPLAEGEYAFMFLIDGTEWMAPPFAEDFATDGFGNTNGIVVVR